MFFLTYLRRELRRRMRQAVFIALGLALGIGLVITVVATTSGVRNAQNSVLKTLYGIGTDIAVTKPPPSLSAQSGPPPAGSITVGPQGACVYNTKGKCVNAAGKTIQKLSNGNLGTIPVADVASVAKLHNVTAASGWLSLDDEKFKIPASLGQSNGVGAGPASFPTPTTFGVDGVDLSHRGLGPLSGGTVTSGRNLTSSDNGANVAVVDSNYAVANKLKVGSALSIKGTSFKIIGIVSQPQGSNPPDAYIPLDRAQSLGTSLGKSLAGQVNTIYVTAASAADIAAVQHEISTLLPSATVTTSSSLASQVTGSLSNTASLADNLGRWLSIMVLVAAFVLASLLTIAAVSRRVGEFGTLKAIGWRSRRIVGQVMGESLTTGIIGGVSGVVLGVAGAALVSKLAPTLYATVGQANPSQTSGGTGGETIHRFTPSTAHTVPIHLSAPVTVSAIVLAVVLAIAGGLIAGLLGSWRAARLRPAEALGRVE